VTHVLRVNCDKTAGDRPLQPAYQFSALNIGHGPLGSRRAVHVGVKEGYPL